MNSGRRATMRRGVHGPYSADKAELASAGGMRKLKSTANWPQPKMIIETIGMKSSHWPISRNEGTASFFREGIRRWVPHAEFRLLGSSLALFIASELTYSNPLTGRIRRAFTGGRHPWPGTPQGNLFPLRMSLRWIESNPTYIL
jgi:hypothetical protein